MRRRAFTLIELLVVIAIIAILAAILFPVFARAKEAGKAAACLTHARQLGLSFRLYTADYDDTLPPSAYANSEGVFLWHKLLQPYVKSRDIWWCPSSSLAKFDADGEPTAHYGYNAHYLTGLLVNFSNFTTPRPVSETAVADPSGTVLIADSISSVPGSWCGDDGKHLIPPSLGTADCWGVLDPRHNGRGTVVWVDGSAVRRSRAQLQPATQPIDRWFDLE